LPAPGIFYGVDCIGKITDVLETLVNGGKTNVGDLVEFQQLLHHHFADLARTDLAFAQGKDFLRDMVDGSIDQFGGNRALV
jgi:hypothetical protein